ncbi:HD domain-containing protein [Candidatus Phytoplasma melaleucae]|uniref:HD domain-containing protein n=1 Tax=Candidatus Phytoplasma melaleucae TaxID=2982630 RepID=A0ABT9DFD9_9MOLU|nr:HD domain-containing protein ['Melaleuca sp.' phytoplasma]MDO8167890.1 HD domain-containing protein ['Melaleuca sp.' phytoplasma]
MYQKQTDIFKEKEIGQTYQITGKITSFNKGDNFHNVNVLIPENTCVNIKLDKNYQNIIVDKIYIFQVIFLLKNDKNIFLCQKIDPIEDVLNLQRIYELYFHFFTCAPLSFDAIAALIEKFLSIIKNPILKRITFNLYTKNKQKFLISPAAFKMHHNYYGGLGYHTTNMLKIAELLSPMYPCLNVDLLYSGIILHDMFKIQEFDFTQKNYTKEGILLGHLILGVNHIHEEAVLLNVQNQEEILLLKHLIISHHGLLEYGAFKKPQTSEAFLLWHLDNIDAKLTVLKEILEKTDKGDFSDPLAILEKKCFYKPDLTIIPE